MTLVNIIMGQLITFVVLGLAVAAVIKMFQLSSDLNDLLRAVNAEGQEDYGKGSFIRPGHDVRRPR